MVKKILNLFYREYGGLHKAALILAVSSIVSAAFGLLRDRLLAGNFGAGESFGCLLRRFQNTGLHLHNISLHHIG